MIVFNYGVGHTVDEVKESDYKSCIIGYSISSGATTTPLKKQEHIIHMCYS